MLTDVLDELDIILNQLELLNKPHKTTSSDVKNLTTHTNKLEKSIADLFNIDSSLKKTLLALLKLSHATADEIVSVTKRKKQTETKNLNELEKKGYIRVVSSDIPKKYELAIKKQSSSFSSNIHDFITNKTVDIRSIIENIPSDSIIDDLKLRITKCMEIIRQSSFFEEIDNLVATLTKR